MTLCFFLCLWAVCPIIVPAQCPSLFAHNVIVSTHIVLELLHINSPANSCADCLPSFQAPCYGPRYLIFRRAARPPFHHHLDSPGRLRHQSHDSLATPSQHHEELAPDLCPAGLICVRAHADEQSIADSQPPEYGFQWSEGLQLHEPSLPVGERLSVQRLRERSFCVCGHLLPWRDIRDGHCWQCHSWRRLVPDRVVLRQGQDLEGDQVHHGWLPSPEEVQLQDSLGRPER